MAETKTIFEILGKSKGIWERCNLSIVALEQKNAAVSTTHTKRSILFCVGIVTHSNKTFAIGKTRYTLGSKYHGNLDTNHITLRYFEIFKKKKKIKEENCVKEKK